MGQGMMGDGETACENGALRSNGERLYFTATSERDAEITYTGDPLSSGWMMMGTYGIRFVSRLLWAGWQTQHGYDASDGFQGYSLVSFATRI